MAEQLHTKEPWLFCKHNNLDFPEITDFDIKTADGALVAETHELVGRHRLSVNPLENARRIVACVNACVGIATEELIEQTSQGRLIKLTECKPCEQREELLSALLVALPFVEDHEDNKVYKPGAVASTLKKIREAIAKVEAT